MIERPRRPIDDILQLDDVAVPSHFVMARPPLTGARRLNFAVLEDAIGRVAKYGRPNDRRAAREVQWFAAADRRGFFSFLNVCDRLGLEPSCIRRGLAQLAPVTRVRREAVAA